MSAPSAPPRDDYHHGHLRDAALKEGLRALEAGEELSMRAIARARGVAHRALFNHFPDRTAFEAALSARGFDGLATALHGTKTPRAFVKTYASFALDNFPLYDLMMRQSYEAFEGHPELRASADKVIATSLRVLAPHAPDAEAGRRMVMRLWMMTHGGVSLHRAGVLRKRADPAFIEELLKVAGLAPDAPEGHQPLWTPSKGRKK